MVLKSRDEIDEKYRCDLSQFFANDDECYEALDEVEEQMEQIENYKGQLGSQDKLLEYKKLDDEIYLKFDALQAYAALKLDLDTNDSDALKLYDEVSQVYQDYLEIGSFVDEELKLVGVDYLKSVVANPKFADFKLEFEKFIEGIPHTLSEHDEVLVSKMANFVVTERDFKAFLHGEMHIDRAFDSEGNLHEVSLATYPQLTLSKDRTLRKNAFIALSRAVANSKNTLFSYISKAIKADDFTAELKNYNSVLEGELIENDLPQEVFDKVLSKAKQYGYLRKERQEAIRTILGYDKLMPWDMRVELAKLDKKVTFEDACETLSEAFKCLGTAYTDNLKRAVEERWCDVMPSKGKSADIYCMTSYGKKPTLHFNWSYGVEDILTLAHEFGHGVNALITDSKQPFSLCEMPWCLVEVPSLTVETIAYLYLVDHAKTDEEKIVCMQNYLSTLNANILDSVYCAELEKFIRDTVREGDTIDVETISDFSMNYDNENSIVPKMEGAKYNWMTDGHIFVPYYNYNYALDMLISCYYAQKIYADDKKVLNDFYRFMESGGSKRTMELMQESGIDLLDDKIYDEAFAFYENITNDFTALANKVAKKNNNREQNASK